MTRLGYGNPGPSGIYHGNGRRPFGSEEDRIILKYYRPGQQFVWRKKPGQMTVRQIAEKLKRPPNSIVSRYHRLRRHEREETKPCYTPRLLQGAQSRQMPSMPKLKFLGEV